MGNKLLPDEINQLTQFRLGDIPSNSSIILPLEELLIEGNMSVFIEELQLKINAPDSKVSASMFAKRYGFFAVLCLFAMTILDKKLDTSIQHVSLEMEDKDQVWLPKFIFSKMVGISPNQGKREEWRDQIIKAIFADHIHMIIESLYKETKISKLILWENIAIYIFWLYENVLADPKFEDKKERIEEDFHYIVEKANGHLFGPFNHNPITRFYTGKPVKHHIQNEVRIRTTCCYFYKTTENNDRCNTCPLNCK